MSLPTPDIEKLRELAMKATEWSDEAIIDTCAKCREEGTAEYFISGLEGGYHAAFGDEWQAKLIAAARPSVILALLDSLPSPVSVPEGELLPCPFCGGAATHFKRADRESFVPGLGARIECTICPAFVEDDQDADVIAAWNRRKHDTAALLSAESRARREGREEMRERAAALVSARRGSGETDLRSIAHAIRSLSSPEEG